MPTKDYRNQRLSQSNKNDKRGESFKKTSIGFAIGLFIGLSGAASVHLYHLGIIGSKQLATPASEEVASEPSKDNASNPTPIDFQFYEMLQNFKFPETQTAQRNVVGEPVAPVQLYILQAGTFISKEQAEAQLQQLIKLGYKHTHTYTFVVAGKQYYRVWLGPYGNLAEAKTKQKTLRSHNIQVLLSDSLQRFTPE